MNNKCEIWQAIRRRRTMGKLCQKQKNRRKNKGKFSPSSIVRTPRFYKRYVLYSCCGYYGSDYANKKELIIKSALLPRNLSYVLNTVKSPFYYETLKKYQSPKDGTLLVPENFSIIDNPHESFMMLCVLLSALFVDNRKVVTLDYQHCVHLDLTTQVILDSLILDYVKFSKLYNKKGTKNKHLKFNTVFRGINITNENVRKMLFSVGTPDVLNIRSVNYDDVTPYHLCYHDACSIKDARKQSEQKDLDTSEMADYVINCLEKVNKQLTSEKLDALCTVIGEALINAEEHSSLRYRYSIGYFQDEIVDGKHEGVFRLVIMNFGNSIYEKFKDKHCPNPEIVKKMEELSEKYTKWSLFEPRFSEESLWTLYALQQGVTSVSPSVSKRGNGCINFIESFFMIKGSQMVDDVSRMTIISGNTRIVFDGHYEISKLVKDGNIYRTMTFNDSGRIEDSPDKRYVYKDAFYFPGTIISAKIMLNEDDVTIKK